MECATQRSHQETLTKLKDTLDIEGEEACVSVHKGCYCSYTSKNNIKKFIAQKRKAETDLACEEQPPPRIRRSQVEKFDFKKQCFFCGKTCEPINSKNPKRWDKVVQCERKGIKGAPAFKESILKCCTIRNDEWSKEVFLRCHSVHDLAAAEAQYHVRCYDRFRKVPFSTDQIVLAKDEALISLIDEMKEHQDDNTWTSTELHLKYLGFGGILGHKQMFSNLLEHLGDDVMVLRLEGCAPIIGYRELVSKIVKVEKLESVDEEREDAVVNIIISEARATPQRNHYDLGDFTASKVKQHTSTTLLRLISKLVSGGEITKVSISLAQAIQQHISHIWNQTTLGLGVDLHHKFGSRDLIDTLYEHGFTVSYDEVLRFRKSAAKFICNNSSTLHQMMGITPSAEIISGWFDNFDLLVSTPNGRRETHAMATEFQIHRATVCNNDKSQPTVSNIVIPRLAPKYIKSSNNTSTIPFLHYTGPKKVIPPVLPSRNVGVDFDEVCAQHASLEAAQEKDVKWLNALMMENEAMEWNGFNNDLSRSLGIIKPATNYMFGPLIDAPPSHPDTIITTLTYMQESLLDMGMMKVHLCMDMQLYQVTKQVCWYHSEKFQNVIAHPGGMHIIQSFISCIGKLMKNSGLEVYAGAAYGGLTGM